MNIKFLNLTPDAFLREQLDDAHARVMESGCFIGGEEVEAFEEEWARYIGVKYCVSCGNGFDALVLAMLATFINSSWHVGVSAFTCLPTWAAVRQTGATLVPFETSEQMNEVLLDAIVPVHLYGYPSPMKENSTARIIEDACQAHGSLYPDGTKVGSRNTAAWSFYPTKNLGCYGDGGAVTTNNRIVAERVRELRNYGGDSRIPQGINSRLDTLQAAYLRVKLPYLDMWNDRRREIAKRYTQELELVTIGPEMGSPNYHQFTLGIKKRDQFRSFLSERGIETMIHYPVPPHRHRSFLAYRNACPLADQWSKETVSIPIGGNLTDEQVEYIIDNIKKWKESNAY